jgi:putative methyltransferase (TIGR04325 family)
MPLKELIRPLVPPILYQAAHHLKKRAQQTGASGLVSVLTLAPEVIETRYPVLLSFSPRASFAEAARECGAGYNSGEILEKAHQTPHAWLKGMGEYLAPALASFGTIVASANGKRLKVLDFGGGNGVFKAYVNDFFDQSFTTDWTVVETSAQVQFNSDVTLDGLHFATSISPTVYDFALFSGSLHYVEDWQAVLRQTNAGSIFISRTPIGSADKPYIQSITRDGHESRVPARVIPRAELFELLSERYELFAKWDFNSHLVEMGLHESPAMLWRRKATGES